MVLSKSNYSYWERLEEFRLSIFLTRRMGDDLIEIFKIMKFLIIVDIFFNISPQTRNLLSRQIWKEKKT